ncbi:MAG TPA: GYF domain-containing protein, partial [Chthoniobacteraceae bacterium]|nr:GYF domain-containing protein [Chthoniobacteraceae bacterium]
MNWFYEYNGEQKGPVSESELDGLIAQGIVLPTTLVWRDGLPNWTPLAQVRATAAPVGGFTPAAGTAQCDSCGRYFDAGDVVQIAGRNICAGCKPAVLQGLQQGTMAGGLSDPSRTGPPWEHRETLGLFPAAYQTVTAVLSRPSETFATMRVDGGITEPFLYNLGVGGVCLAVRVVYFALAQALGMSFSPVSQRNDIFMAGGGIMVMTVLQIVGAFIGTAIGSFIWSAIFHVCLMMFGGARRPFET